MNNTDICNMALAYLAKGRISSIDRITNLQGSASCFMTIAERSIA